MLGRIIFAQEQIKEKVNEISAKINKEYTEAIIITILEGAKQFSSDLIDELKIGIIEQTARIKSYAGKQSGDIQLIRDISTDIKGKDVIIVEDIVDTGKTLYHYIKHLKKQDPRSIRVCALLSKPSRREFEVGIDYLGFEVEDIFIVGYGLDFDGRYRDLPYIAEYKDKGDLYIP